MSPSWTASPSSHSRPGGEPSISPSLTNSFRSTIRGIGSDSGRAFLALGMLMVKGAHAVDMNITLRRMMDKFRKCSALSIPVPMDMSEALLDIIRTDSCPRAARVRVWALLVAIMQSPDAVDDVWSSIWSQWSQNEIKHFLEYLGLLRLSLETEQMISDLRSHISIRDLKALGTSDWKLLICNASRLLCSVVRSDNPALLLNAFSPDIMELMVSQDCRTEPTQNSRTQKREGHSKQNSKPMPDVQLLLGSGRMVPVYIGWEYIPP